MSHAIERMYNVINTPLKKKKKTGKWKMVQGRRRRPLHNVFCSNHYITAWSRLQILAGFGTHGHITRQMRDSESSPENQYTLSHCLRDDQGPLNGIGKRRLGIFPSAIRTHPFGTNTFFLRTIS